MKAPISFLAISLFVTIAQASQPVIEVQAKGVLEQVAEKLKQLKEAQDKQEQFEKFAEAYMKQHIDIPTFSFDLMFDEIKQKHTQEALELLRQQGTSVTAQVEWEFIITQDDAIHCFPIKKKEKDSDGNYTFTLITGEKKYFAHANIKQKAKSKKNVIFGSTGCCVIL